METRGLGLRGWTAVVAVTAVVGITLVAGAVPGAAGAGSRSGSFVALSYNVAGLPEGLSGSNPTVNTPLISPKLNAYDLVLVQEDWVDPVPPIGAFDFFHDDLIAAVDHPYLSVPASPPIGTDPTRPEALIADGLNRMSRFSFGEITRERWTNCFGGIDPSDGGAADCLSQKGFSVATTTFAEGVEVDVYNLHGEAGGTALDEEYSADDYEQLAAFMQSHSEGHAVIVGGDFNLHTDSEPDSTVWAEFLGATGIVAVCDVLDCGVDDDRIDKFAFRSSADITIEPITHDFELDVFQRDDGEPLSDHDALAVTFGWTAAQLPPTTTSTSTTTVPPTTVAAAPLAVQPTFTG